MLKHSLAPLFFVAFFSGTVVGAQLEPSSSELSLANLLPSEEVLWLETKSGKFLSLQREHMAKERRGIAILVPDITTNVINPDYIEPLRQQLNRVGWATLSIMPPAPDLLQQSTAYSQALVERINAAMTWGKEHHQHAVLIAQGQQMAYLIDAQVQQHLQPINAIVLINAEPAAQQATKELSEQYPDSQPLFSQQITALALPILDLNQSDHSQPLDHLTDRDALAMKQHHSNYRQLRFFARENYQPATKAIYGWLTNLGLK